MEQKGSGLVVEGPNAATNVRGMSACLAYIHFLLPRPSASYPLIEY